MLAALPTLKPSSVEGAAGVGGGCWAAAAANEKVVGREEGALNVNG